MKLSVTVITFNEGENIERCLNSVKCLADEIVVVDSLSTDNTVSICKKHKAKVYFKKFMGYGKQKRYAVECAENDFILSIDADEELSENMQKSILKVKSELNFAGYTFNRLNFYCNTAIKHCGWYPDIQLRLFNRKLINWDDRSVHEKVLPNFQKIKHLNGDLYHYTCLTIDQHKIKEEKYAHINADILAGQGKHILFFTPYIKYIFRFFKTFILKQGILDGRYGFIISKTLAHSSFLKYELARQRTTSF